MLHGRPHPSPYRPAGFFTAVAALQNGTTVDTTQEAKDLPDAAGGAVMGCAPRPPPAVFPTPAVCV